MEAGARLGLSVNVGKLLLTSDQRSEGRSLYANALHSLRLGFQPVRRVVNSSQMSDIPNGSGAQGSLGTPSFRILALLLLLLP